MSSQNIDGILPQILNNLTLKIIGKIPVTAIRSFEQAFDYPYQIISQCATKDFEPTESYTSWLLEGISESEMGFELKATSSLDRFTFCRHYLR